MASFLSTMYSAKYYYFVYIMFFSTNSKPSNMEKIMEPYVWIISLILIYLRVLHISNFKLLSIFKIKLFLRLFSYCAISMEKIEIIIKVHNLSYFRTTIFRNFTGNDNVYNKTCLLTYKNDCSGFY